MPTLPSSLFVVGSVLLAGPLQATPSPPAIAQGDDVGACGWPSAVSMLRNVPEDGSLTLLCTGTLVGPTTILTAAHCLLDDAPIVAVGFGELAPPAGEPQRIVEVTDCAMPEAAQPAGSINTVQNDVALCHLAESVTDVPIVPPISECELDAVVPGAQVTIVGFGATSRIPDPEGAITEGSGTKRRATQILDELDLRTWHNATMFNLDGPGACSGDSGGPAFIQLDDGSWRVFGAGSSGYLPRGAQPPDPPGTECWAGSVYSLIGLYGDWLREEAGVELACHDAAGLRTDVAACEALQSDPEPGHGAGTRGCQPGPTVGEAQTCRRDPSGTDSSGSGGSDADSGLASDGSSTTTSPESTTGSPSDTTDGTTSVAATAGPTDGSEDDGANRPGSDPTDSDASCACSTPVGPPDPGIALFALVVFGGIRRRSHPRPGSTSRDPTRSERRSPS